MPDETPEKNEEITEEQAAVEQPAAGEAIPEETTSSEAASDDAASGEVAPEADTSSEAPAEQPAADEAAPEAAASGGAASSGAASSAAKLTKAERRAANKKPRPRTPEEREEARRRKAAIRRTYRARVKRKREELRAAQPAQEPDQAPEHGPGRPKVRQGVVVSDKADKTITVRIDVAKRHRRYNKILRTSTRLHAHDERNEANAGDTVRIVESRPLSRSKRWRLTDVLERAK